MKELNDFINSGILEAYVLGLTSEEENRNIELKIKNHPELRQELDAITQTLISHAEAVAPPLSSDIKPMVLAVIDYTERLKNGEAPSAPPIITKASRIADFESWLNRADMVLSNDFDDIEVKLIGYQPDVMTAIVWIKDATPHEVHDNEYEKFLIVEGSCDVVTDTNIYSLVPGDSFTVPLYTGHVVKVTSEVPCKVILQRVAA